MLKRIFRKGPQPGEPVAAPTREHRVSARQLRAGLSTALLVVVVGAPAAASFHGLMLAGVNALGLTGWWATLVPLVLDAGAAYTAVLAVRDVLAGDSAVVNRLLTWIYAAGSAAMNAWYADQAGGLAAALYFAGASLSAVVLWDRTLRALRRDQLRERGAMQAPTPRFRLARWVVAFKETRQAWCVAVVEGITDPAQAVRMARQLAETGTTVAALPAADLRGLSKGDAIRTALRELDIEGRELDTEDKREAAEWLAERGVQVSPSYVGDIVRRPPPRARTRDTAEPVAELSSGEQRLHAAS